MPIFARIDGIQYPIRDCEKIRIPESITNNLEKIIDLVNPEIELNFVLNGKLGYELTKDKRMKPLDSSIVKIYNGFRGAVFKNNGLITDPLFEQYEDEKICYVSLWSNNFDDLLITIIHEFCHFSEPFKCNIEVFSKVGAGYYLTREKYAENEVNRLLNERYANFQAFSIYINPLKQLPNKNILIKEIERIKTRIFNHIDRLDIEFINSLNDLIGMKSKEFQTQHHADIKFFDILFRQIHYFLGGLDALNSEGINTRDLKWAWYRLVWKVRYKIIKNLESFLLPRDYRISLVIFKILGLDINNELDKKIRDVRKIVKDSISHFLLDLKDSIQDYDHLRDTFNLAEYSDRFKRFIKSETLLIIIYLSTLGFYESQT